LVLLNVCLVKYRKILAFIKFSWYIADIEEMNGLTINEMCEALKLPFKTVEARIQRSGIKPITRQAIYPPETLEIIKNIKMGRPSKAKPEAQDKPKKAAKK
jgi:hypothetical protein